MTTIQMPTTFRWGAATSSYQIEGAFQEGGRGLSIWDTFSRTPGKTAGGHTGDIACDSYHRYEEDVALLKRLGVNSYRFSVAWPRIFPDGTGAVNEAGIDYYMRLVDKLLENGIEPMCTLYHWDLPQALQNQGGWANRATIDAFVRYAETMFRAFDGKITRWITLNEPWCASFLSNYLGVHAPGYRDLQLATDVAHHLLVAHGAAVEAFRRLGVPGEIGIAPNITWIEPYSARKEDIDACRRETGWWIDYFIDPLFHGAYPAFMLEWLESKGAKPTILEGDMERIAAPIDFLGLNYYTGNLGKYKRGAGLFDCEPVDEGYAKTDIDWFIYPEGFYKAIQYIAQQYGNTPIYITENGACYNDGLEADGTVNDDRRIAYMRQHLLQLHRCIASGYPVQGYYAWSLMDNFEWAEGYEKRFGIVHVDFETLKRTPKASYFWYQKVIGNGTFEV